MTSYYHFLYNREIFLFIIKKASRKRHDTLLKTIKGHTGDSFSTLDLLGTYFLLAFRGIFIGQGTWIIWYDHSIFFCFLWILPALYCRGVFILGYCKRYILAWLSHQVAVPTCYTDDCFTRYEGTEGTQ